MNCIKKVSVRIVDNFDTYEKAIKNTLLNKLAIETPDNKLQEVTYKMVQKNLIIFLVLLRTMHQCMAKRTITANYREIPKVNYRQEDEIINSPCTFTLIECDEYRTNHDGKIDITRCK